MRLIINLINFINILKQHHDMKNILKLSLLLVGFAALVFSCRKEELDLAALTDFAPGIASITPADKEDMPMKGIYELNGDSLKICTVEQRDGERPGSFDSKVEKKAVLLTLKRQK